MTKFHTQVTAEARGLSNVFVVRIVGTKGSAVLYRRSWDDARASARKYAHLLDSPRSVLGT